MQRSKVAVSVEVKQVIGALCRLLAASGLTAVPAPDTFRRAKFGVGLEVEDQFWQLLADILQTASIVSSEDRAKLGGAAAAEHRRLVAAGLWQTGYHAEWMRCGREGGRLPSRDLLLALGWLLATGTLEKLLTQRVLQLDKTLLTPTPVNARLSKELQSDPASLRKLQWLIGRLRHQGRTLLSMQEERTLLLHAVLFASLPSSVSSSAQSSTVLKEDCVCIRQLCDLLEAYLNWKQVEKVFWTWMDSVVDSHLTDLAVEKPTHAPDGSARLCHHGNRGLEKLEDMLLILPTVQHQRRGRGGAEDIGEGVERLQDGPDTSSTLLQHFYRARLQSERPVKGSSHPAEGPRGGAQAPDQLPASQATKLLLHTEALLLERRDTHRMHNRMQLQEMVGRLDKVVLIPP